jgi:hypothetical protein
VFHEGGLLPEAGRGHLVLVDNSGSIMGLVELPVGRFRKPPNATFISRF